VIYGPLAQVPPQAWGRCALCGASAARTIACRIPRHVYRKTRLAFPQPRPAEMLTQWLARAAGPVRMRLVLTRQMLADVDSFNVVGDLKGSEHPEQIVIVSGHLDCGPGHRRIDMGQAWYGDADAQLSSIWIAPKKPFA